MPEYDELLTVQPVSNCLSCGTELATALLACPACGALIHAERLTQLAAAVDLAETPGDALALWREAYQLLPAGTRQQSLVAAKIEELVTIVDQPRHAKTASMKGKIAAGAGAVALFLVKFKFVLLFIVTKLKFLAIGLTKVGTLFSMFLSFGLYWSLWGWKFAAGFIISIYIHEMGHVAMLTRLGVRASAPMFIPGLGAVIRLRENLPTAREDARVGLAGPIWGLGAAVCAWLIGEFFHLPLATAIAKVGAWINLFNLTPVWQLDGSRAFRALTKKQRGLAIAAVFAALFFAKEDVHGILIIVLGFGVFRLFEKTPEASGDKRALIEYIVLVAALTAIASLPAISP